jgi:protein TonB
VKRILLAASIALIIHGFFLGTDPAWLKRRPVHRPETRVITMILAYRQPAVPKPKPVVKAPEITVRKPPTIVKKTEKKSFHKPEETKKVPAAVTPTKSPLPKKEIAVLKQEPSGISISEPAPPPEHELKDINRDSSPDLPYLKEEILEEEAPVTDDRVKPSPPLYQKNPPPEYPRLARRKGYEGIVVLEVLVDEEGRVEDMRLFRSSKHRILDRAAMASVKKWLFEPGMRGGEPVEMWVKIPIRFQLK